MSSLFLLSTSFIYENSQIIENIHQSYIDLKSDASKYDVQNLLNEAILALDKADDLNLANELSYLISACFSLYPKDFLSIFAIFFKKSRLNTFRILTTASILATLTNVEPSVPLFNYESFVNDALNEILPQIQTKEFKTICVFGREIPNSLKYDFIIDLLLSAELTNDLLSNFIHFVLSQPYKTQNSKFVSLVKYITKSGFTSKLPTTILIDIFLYESLSIDSLTSFLPFISDDLFIKLFPRFEKTFIESPNLTLPFILSILDRCDKLNLRLQKIEKIFNFLSPSDLTNQVIEQLKKYDFFIPKEFVEYFKSSGNESKIVNVYSDFYEYFNDDIKYIKVNEQNFQIFEKMYEERKYNEIIDDLIFNDYPPNRERVNLLFDFIEYIKKEKNENFFSNEIDKYCIQKILEQDTFPPIYLINSVNSILLFELIQKAENENDQNHQHLTLLMYLFAFAMEFENGPNNQLEKITILPFQIDQNEIFVEFIKTNDFNLLHELDKETLRFCICSLLLVKEKVNNIYGLTNENILPFYAIYFNNINEVEYIDHIFLEYEWKTVLQYGCKNLSNNNSNVLNSSINVIISTINSQIILFKSEFPLVIIHHLINLFINNEYLADKALLIKMLLILSNHQSYKLHFENCFNILARMIHNLDILIQFYKNEGLKMNLIIFEPNEISHYCAQIIQSQSSTYKDVFNTIYFIQNLVVKEPALKLTNSKKLVNTAIETINMKEWNNLSLILNFINKNGLKKEVQKILNEKISPDIRNKFLSLIPIDERSCDDFISIFLGVPNPEKNDSMFEDLFKRIMTEKESAIEYLKILIYAIVYLEFQTPKAILQFYLNEYLKYGDLFIKAMDSYLVYHPNEKVFVRKAEVNFVKFTNSNFVNSLLSKLIKLAIDNPERYQPFYFLKNIACSFPFFFDRNSEKIFEAVLKPFDNYSLIFDNEYNDAKEEELRLNKIKASVTALSFIISALCSNRVIDSFFKWIFKRIEKFSLSQTFCFLIIISSIIKSNKNIAMLAIMQSNINIFESLSNKTFPNQIFGDIYIHIIYNILADLFTIANEVDIVNSVAIDELKTYDYPYCHCLNYKSTMFPIIINQIKIDYKNKTISDFHNEIERTKPFWYRYFLKNAKQNISEDQVNRFMNHYKKIVDIPPSISNIGIVTDMTLFITDKLIRYIFKKGYWIYLYIFCDRHFPLLPEHVKILNKVINKVNTFPKKLKHSIFSLDKQKFLAGYLDNMPLFQFIYRKTFTISLFNAQKNLLIFSKLSISNSFVEGFIKFLTLMLDIIIENNDLLLMFVICNLCLDELITISSSKVFQKKIIQNGLVNKLIQIIMYPQCRNNINFIGKVGHFLFSTIPELPINTSHIIGFLLLLNDQRLYLLAIKLCSKYNPMHLTHLKIIQDYYKRELYREDISLPNITCFCEYYPNIVKTNKEKSFDVLQSVFQKYTSINISQENKVIYGDFIFLMLEALAPSRDICQSFSMSSTIELKSGNRKFSFQPIPDFVFNSDPNFWKFFDENRLIIIEIIDERKDKLSNYKLFTDYPELFDFKLRLKYFRQRIESKINQNEKTILNINRNDIINSSYNEFKKHEFLHNNNSRWFHNFYVKYKDEVGIDTGGLTKDFLFNVTKAFFEKGAEFFVEKEKTRSYQPNGCSTKYEFFLFAGKLIARAIIEGVCTECHFTQPFIKQILHRKITFSDLESIDPIKFSSLNEILDQNFDEDDPLNEYFFEVTKEGSDGHEVVELKENGSQIKVTNENKSEYVHLLSNYYLRDSIIEQIRSFSFGFDSLISHNEISYFSASEFDLILCGVPFIDVEDMRQFAQYSGEYNSNTPAVKLFFDSIAKWEQENLAKLLLFFTGSSTVPIGGFKNELITIAPGGDKNFLPKAHTCFNTLDLPEYETEDELNHKFMIAINQIEYTIS